MTALQMAAMCDVAGALFQRVVNRTRAGAYGGREPKEDAAHQGGRAKRSNIKAVLFNRDVSAQADCVVIRDLHGVIALIDEAG
jgi:hypothetical protein